jgi:uncharacterized protein YqjF (DUF2071 family)
MAVESAPRREVTPGRFLTARWRYLAMLNWRVDADLVRPLAPRGTEIDFHEGETFVSVVGFLFLGTRVLTAPVPFHTNFEEVNLRFYVRREAGGEVRRGVTFVKEIVPRWAIARMARLFYNENYVALPMSHELRETAPGLTTRGKRLHGDDEIHLPRVEYRWRRGGAWEGLTAQAASEPRPLAEGSLEQFIAEHYWGYCAQRDGGSIEYRVEHPSWRVWSVSEATFNGDARSLYGPAFADVLSRPCDFAFLADGSAVAVGRPRRVDG